MLDFVIKQGDLKPYFEAELFDADGLMNLTGCTAKFIMAPATGGPPKVNAACAIIEGRRVRYMWVEGDTSEAGSYNAEIEITDGSGSKQTVPNDRYLQIQVIKELG